MRNDKEHQEQCAVIRWCKLHEKKYPVLEMIFAIPNAGGFSGGFKFNVGRVQKLKAEGVKSGVPDLFLPVSSCKKPGNLDLGLFIEMKSGKGRLEDNQKWWINKLLNYNYQAKVCCSWVEAVQAIIDYLGLPERI